MFPGGRLDPQDGSGESGLRSCAVRELREEVGVSLTAEDLAPWARWVTPAAEPKRFDTRFYLARMPAGANVERHPTETADARWFPIPQALAEGRAGQLRLMPPTLRNLELLATIADWPSLRAAAERADLAPICPTLEMIDDAIVIILPGDPRHPERQPRVPGPTRIVFRDGRFQSEDPPA